MASASIPNQANEGDQAIATVHGSDQFESRTPATSSSTPTSPTATGPPAGGSVPIALGVGPKVASILASHGARPPVLRPVSATENGRDRGETTRVHESTHGIYELNLNGQKIEQPAPRARLDTLRSSGCGPGRRSVTDLVSVG